jgi:hypothetical protein
MVSARACAVHGPAEGESGGPSRFLPPSLYTRTDLIHFSPVKLRCKAIRSARHRAPCPARKRCRHAHRGFSANPRLRAPATPLSRRVSLWSRTPLDSSPAAFERAARWVKRLRAVDRKEAVLGGLVRADVEHESG